jgi:large subunit ribosomal protein L15
MRRGFEGGQMPLLRRIPKRGFHHRKRYPFATVNLDVLDRAFEANALVTPEALLAARLVEVAKGGVKVLGRGELSKKLTVRVNEVTPTARAKIEAAGGTVEIIDVPAAPAYKKAQEES